ncbi:hypothetical protein ACC754_39025, partial [Rhizobium johnstonii]
FADGSGWKGVYDNLTKRGYRVTIFQNPLTSLEDDVAATKRALERQDGPVILVGHSWGGNVVFEGGQRVLDDRNAIAALGEIVVNTLPART